MLSASARLVSAVGSAAPADYYGESDAIGAADPGGAAYDGAFGKGSALINDAEFSIWRQGRKHLPLKGSGSPPPWRSSRARFMCDAEALYGSSSVTSPSNIRRKYPCTGTVPSSLTNDSTTGGGLPLMCTLNCASVPEEFRASAEPVEAMSEAALALCVPDCPTGLVAYSTDLLAELGIAIPEPVAR